MQKRFTRFLRAGGDSVFRPPGGGALAFAAELKVCRGEKFLWKSLEEHQAASLAKVAGIFDHPPLSATHFRDTGEVGEVLAAGSGGLGGGKLGVGCEKKKAGGEGENCRAGFGLAHKISDSALGFKPFDCFYMHGCAGWLVIGYRGGSAVVAIEVRRWLADYMREVGTRGGGVPLERAVEAYNALRLEL